MICLYNEFIFVFYASVHFFSGDLYEVPTEVDPAQEMQEDLGEEEEEAVGPVDDEDDDDDEMEYIGKCYTCFSHR